MKLVLCYVFEFGFLQIVASNGVKSMKKQHVSDRRLYLPPLHVAAIPKLSLFISTANIRFPSTVFPSIASNRKRQHKQEDPEAKLSFSSRHRFQISIKRFAITLPIRRLWGLTYYTCMIFFVQKYL